VGHASPATPAPPQEPAPPPAPPTEDLTTPPPVPAPEAGKFSIGTIRSAIQTAVDSGHNLDVLERRSGMRASEALKLIDENLQLLQEKLASELRMRLDYVVAPNLQPYVFNGALVEDGTDGSIEEHALTMTVSGIGYDLVQRIAAALHEKGRELSHAATVHASRPDFAFAGQQLTSIAEELSALRLPLPASEAAVLREPEPAPEQASPDGG